MKITNSKTFSGKNIYSYKKCIRIDVDLCGYSEIPSKDIPDFNDNLLMLVPELYTHRCGIDEEGGFVKRLNEGTYLAHICEHIIIAIQNKLGIDVSYGKAREIKEEMYYIIFQYEYKSTGIETAKLAVDIINALINNEKINVQNRIKLLEKVMKNELIGPSTKSILEAAKQYGLPIFELEDSGFYQLGYGKQGRVIEATLGANTSCVAADIACDKFLTKELLSYQNIPVAKGNKVCNIIGLLKEGENIGYPVVLKPRYGCKGNGVLVNIQTEKELIQKYNQLKKMYNDLIIEKYIEGNDYRVCIVDYNVVAVSHRKPPYVKGDGKHDIKHLIMKLNEDPLRGIDHEKPLTKVKICEELLSVLYKQDMTLASVPKKNQIISLRENANLSSGGVAIDCTNDICKQNIDICIRAAKAIGLDICGIDIKANDISKPLYDQGIIVEVNAAPGIRMHEYPMKGNAVDVADSIVKLQYNGIPKNIPVISITGTNGKTTTTRLIAHVLSIAGYNVGMTSTDGIYINNKCIESGDDTGFNSAKAVLLNKDVEVAVLETARGGIIKNGLAYDTADVAVLTNISEDHIGLNGVNSIEDLAFVKSLVLEAVKEDGYAIMNADDKYTKMILPRVKCKKIYFSRYSDNSLITNMDKDDLAVYIKDNYILIKEGNNVRKIIDVCNIPITLNGLLDFNIENSMAAVSTLLALGIPDDKIIKGIKMFKLDCNYSKGRFNMYDIDGVKVILDYGHNVEGYKSVLKSLMKIKKERIIGVIGVPGDRRDENIKLIGTMCSNVMDKIIIKEDADKRGRNEGEVAKILEQSIINNNQGTKCSICLDEVKAFKDAIDISQKGDIVIIFYEKIDPLIDVLKEFYDTGYKLNLAT